VHENFSTKLLRREEKTRKIFRRGFVSQNAERRKGEKASLSNTNTSATWIFHIFPLSADVRKKSNFETAKHDVWSSCFTV
jgi:hypothetical protein